MIVETSKATSEVANVIIKVLKIIELIFNFFKIRYRQKIENDVIITLASLP